jgi:hypothetical protein
VERSDRHEVNMLVEGTWGDLHVALAWREDSETLEVACTFGARIPPPRRAEAARLALLVNARLLHGHFDLWPGDGSLIYRNSLMLTGGARLNDAQCDALIGLAVATCQRYFPAIQFVVWGGRTAADGLEASLLETMGEA